MLQQNAPLPRQNTSLPNSQHKYNTITGASNIINSYTNNLTIKINDWAHTLSQPIYPSWGFTWIDAWVIVLVA